MTCAAVGAQLDAHKLVHRVDAGEGLLDAPAILVGGDEVQVGGGVARDCTQEGRSSVRMPQKRC